MNKVIELDKEQFEKSEGLIKIAVDTNILLFVFYGRISLVKDNDTLQTQKYQSFIAKILKNKNIRLYTLAVNLNEAFHVIEKTECDIYNDSIVGAVIDLKSFRKQPKNNAANKKQFNMLYRQVARTMTILDYNIDSDFIKSYISQYDKANYDCLDAALANCCKDNGIKYILTDDIDFVNIDGGVDVLTANRKALYFAEHAIIA